MSQSFPRLQHRLLVSAAPDYAAQTVLNRIAPMLRQHFATLTYWGQSSPMPVIKSGVFDSFLPATTSQKANFLREYDVYLNIMSPEDASMAIEQGLSTIIYDNVLKYGNTPPSAIRSADILLTPGFYAISNKVRHIRPAGKDTVIVPPFSRRASTPAKRDIFFVSFCGLDNTTDRHGNDLDYVRSLMSVLQKTLPSHLKRIIAAAPQVAKAMPDFGIKHYTREEIENILAQSSKALMTSSLQHIFDAVSHHVDTLWLPPARPTDGQNLQAIQRRKVLNIDSDWSGITSARIDYEGDDIYVLGCIHREIRKLLTEPKPQEKLERLIQTHIKAQNDMQASHKMSAAFGTNGQNVMLNAILTFARTRIPVISGTPPKYARA